MYILNRFDYKTSKNEAMYMDTFRNTRQQMEEYCHNYILEKQGDNIEISFENFVYENNETPNRQRALTHGAFYIRKSKYDPNKLTVCEKKKIYGYLYNTYQIIPHLNFTISYDGPIQYPFYYNDNFTLELIYDKEN
jgi:hypothetical protein